MKNNNNYLRTNAKKQAYKNKGITLVALIITIVVMLILVAVSVNVIVNSDLIGHAEKIGDAYKNAVAEEEGYNPTFGNGKTLEDYMAGIEKLPDIEAGVRAEINSNYKGVTIPKGFTVSGISTEQSVDGGLVIYDIPEGRTVNWTNPDSVKTQYNQFVWIPVEVNKTTEPKDTETSIASFKRSVWQDNARVANNAQSSTSFPSSSYSWSNYTEPYSKDSSDYDGTGTGKTGISAQITELTQSIYKYGGFYIGRYEAGSETERTNSSGVTTLGIKQDMYPYIYVKWGDSMSNIGTTGAVYLSNSLYTGKTGYGVKSMLCTGAAWDSMLDFVKDSNHSVTDSTTWGNYKNSETFEITRGSYAVLNTSSYTLGSFNNVESNYSKMKGKSILLTTGATERNSSKNIYDVAGNCYEWTTGAYDTSTRVFRGGIYGSDGSDVPASYRDSLYPTSSSYTYSFRPLLYVAL